MTLNASWPETSHLNYTGNLIYVRHVKKGSARMPKDKHVRWLFLMRQDCVCTCVCACVCVCFLSWILPCTPSNTLTEPSCLQVLIQMIQGGTRTSHTVVHLWNVDWYQTETVCVSVCVCLCVHEGSGDSNSNNLHRSTHTRAWTHITPHTCLSLSLIHRSLPP